MDLTDMMTEPSIIDHSWWNDGLIHPGEPTFDAAGHQHSPNNTKPELAMEWSTAGPNISFDEPAGVVERNIPDDALGDAEPVIIFARDQMNRGLMGAPLIASIKQRFSHPAIKAAEKELREQLALQGIVGCVVLDGRGYKSCREAMEAAKNSPYKAFIKYVMGCNCGDPQMVPTNRGTHMHKVVEANANAIDDFFERNDVPEPVMEAHCRSTMLPILSGAGDLDDSEMDSTLIEMMNVTGLPEDLVKKMRKDRHNDKYSSNLKVVQAAFKHVQASAEASQEAPYVAPVDNSEHYIQTADNEIKFDGQPQASIGVALGHSMDIEYEPERREAQVDGRALPMEVPLDREPVAEGVLDIDAQQKSLDIELSAQDSLGDVEMEQFRGKTFEGTDIIDLDELKAPPGELDIQMGSEITI